MEVEGGDKVCTDMNSWYWLGAEQDKWEKCSIKSLPVVLEMRFHLSFNLGISGMQVVPLPPMVYCNHQVRGKLKSNLWRTIT